VVWSTLIIATATVLLLAGLSLWKVCGARLRPALSRRAVCADASNSSIPPRHNSIELYSARIGDA
jgi:hypothetical protein